MELIGFIGLGSIGAPMAKCVVKAGYKLIACDISAPAREKFEKTAVRVTDRPANCAKCEMVIVMVSTDSQVREVILAPNGVLNAVDPNRPPLLAIMSTILPQTTQEIAIHCKEKNVHIVDAPVSGGPLIADQGGLTIMVGGEEADLEAMRPVLEAMGKNIYYMGALGSGNVAKLVNNIIGVTNFFLTVEAMLVGKKCGIDPHKLAEVLETCTGRNFSTEDWEKSLAFFKFFSQNLTLSKVLLDLARKDLEHAQQLATKVKLICPLVDEIVRVVNNFSYEEIMERWRSITT